jgi:NADH-quinone oxidoreductase subunit M
MNFPILSIIYLLPLAAVLVIFFIPKERDHLVKYTALGFVSASFILSLVLFFEYDSQVNGLQFVERIEWIPSIGVNYFLAVNGINITLVLLTGAIIVAGVLASWDVKYRPKEFFILLLTLVTGVFGVFTAYNLFLFFLFYEIAVLPMYLLIGIWGTGRKEYSAMKLTLYLMVGSALIFAGILGLYFASGVGSFDLDVIERFTFSPGFQKIFFPILFLGFGILAALWPFHTWSPDGHASAPTAVSMLHAGVLMKLGAYGCLMIAVNLLPEGARFWFPAIAALTVVNIVYGSLGAVAQKDLKYIVAYSSVSHMGIVLLGIASGNSIAIDGAVLQMFSHGIMTGLFFGLVGMVYGRTHTRMVPEMSGLARVMPRLAAFFVLTGLTSLGLPGLSGFVAELLVFVGAYRTYPAITIVCITGIVFTAYYILRVVQKMFYGPYAETDGGRRLTDANVVEFTALALLMVFIAAIGVYPFYIMKVIHGSVLPIAIKLGGM